MIQPFNLDEALELVEQGARIDGKDGVLAPLIKQLTEAALEAEIESHLSTELKNRKNGKSTKTMKSSVGSFSLVFQETVMVLLNLRLLRNIKLIFQNR